MEIVKVPNDKPVTISYDCIIACCGLTIELTTRTVEKLLEPAFALMTAEPIVSPIDIKEIAKEPPSEANNEVDISGSLGSWETLIVKSVKLSQSVLEIETLTVGLKGIHGLFPVFPPTQLPQLSIHAVPLTSPLQSTLKQTILKGKDWISTSPNSELISELKIRLEGGGFTNKFSITTVWLLPEVTLLLSGGEVVTIRIPDGAKFSIVKVPYTWLVLSSIAFTDILLEEIIKSTSRVVLTFI